ncbi:MULTISPECIES: DUF1413 domain-containing protein [Staphylococcus]|uniref:DUF1413 domain-containing protein n=1 Tax=Staphylococcus TaxID=1279 RepID=UPI000CD005C0|nr:MULTISPECIES: DUF1413 domain-containing protein [Staphylococcus]MBX5319543.1 DUF1413 domain-containing protein [Staphylococcus caprae]MDI9230962.1 DUF1413 domain-containing protein [Staphylococcus caprae]POA03493.1 hypothetical protein CD155_09455 [Staphylococcus caprae]SUL94705.1 IraB protein [Staphylococcus caprae]HCG76205.1 DUF1413 domain-containing protein [Staphylococcus sp.]
MSYHNRVLELREMKHRTAFEFHFEDLFTEEEWLNMSLKERQKEEKAFRSAVEKMSDVRLPFASRDAAKNKLFNITYAYNGIKKNFKQNDKKENPRGRIVQ